MSLAALILLILVIWALVKGAFGLAVLILLLALIFGAVGNRNRL